MKILSSRHLFSGLLVLMVTLLMQPAQSFLTSQQPPTPPAKTIVFAFPGVWAGTYPFSDGQVLMYINSAGNLFGSLASNSGSYFAQMSGKHRGNAFHLVFTAPPGTIDQYGHSSSEPVEADATARWEDNQDEFTMSYETTAHHAMVYTFKRLKQT